MFVEVPHELFTPGAVGSLVGASSAVWVLTNVYRVLFKRDSVLVGFILSLVVAFIGAYAAGALNNLVSAFVTFLNGCLLFLTAAGAQGVVRTAAQGQAPGGAQLQGNEKVNFLRPWFNNK